MVWKGVGWKRARHRNNDSYLHVNQCYNSGK